MSRSRATRRSFLHAALLGPVALSLPGTGTPGWAADSPISIGEPIPAAILGAWAERQAKWDRVFCEVSGYTVIAKELLEALPGNGPLPLDKIQQRRVALWIDLENRRLRIERRPGDQWKAEWKAIVYDGQELRGFDDLGRPCRPARMPFVFFEFPYWPLLFGHGVAGGPEGGIVSSNLRRTYDRRNYEVTAVETPRLTVRSKPLPDGRGVVEYDIDASRRGLIVAARLLAGRTPPYELFHDTRITEFAEEMPRKWVDKAFTNGRLVEFSEYTIEKREFDGDFSKTAFTSPDPAS